MAQNKFSIMNQQRHIIESVVRYLEEKSKDIITLSLSSDIIDTLPFYWNKYKVNVYYTFKILLKDNDESSILKNMSVKTRNLIKKAKKDGITADESTDVNILKKLVNKTFSRQNKKFPRKFMEKVLKEFPPGRNSFLFISWKGKYPIAAVYCVYDRKVAYNLMTGYDHERSHSGAQSLAIYKAILKAQSLGLEIFDFEGSMVQNIEKFFRGFGGALVPYYRVSKAKLIL